MYSKDALLKKVWKSEGSYYDVETKRIVVQDDHELNFISVESKKTNNVHMELEMGCHAQVLSDETSEVAASDDVS